MEECTRSCGDEASQTDAFSPRGDTEQRHRPTPRPEFPVAREGKPAPRPDSDTPFVIRTLGRSLLFVVACGLLMELLYPSCGFRGSPYQSDESAARTQMSNFGQAINNHRLSNDRLPATLEELTQVDGDCPYPFIRSIPDDPWGEPYRYRIVDSEHYRILSNGEDSVANTSDDLEYPDEDR